MNRAQQIVAETYCGGELNRPDVMETLDNCGDGLFRFLMVELSDEEDCTDTDDAYNRVANAINQLEDLLAVLDKETT